MRKFLYLFPRIASIIYIVFFFLFAVEIFTIESAVPPLYRIVAVLIHLLPSIVLTILLVIAWNYEKVGGILFILFAAILTIIFDDTLPTNLILFTPLIIIGILFLFHSSNRRFK